LANARETKRVTNVWKKKYTRMRFIRVIFIHHYHWAVKCSWAIRITHNKYMTYAYAITLGKVHLDDLDTNRIILN